MNKAIYLDRDDVINYAPKYNGIVGDPANYILSWDQFEFIPEALEALRLLAKTNYHVIVVSNQACVNKGLVDARIINNIFIKMKNEVIKAGGVIHGWYYCPHTPEENCACRKPKSGMIWQAAVEHEIVLADSWIVGDNMSDIYAGYNAGISKLIKIRSGDKLVYDYRRIVNSFTPIPVYTNLLDAVECILNRGVMEDSNEGS